jgi:hypothetical protein
MVSEEMGVSYGHNLCCEKKQTHDLNSMSGYYGWAVLCRLMWYFPVHVRHDSKCAMTF